MGSRVKEMQQTFFRSKTPLVKDFFSFQMASLRTGLPNCGIRTQPKSPQKIVLPRPACHPLPHQSPGSLEPRGAWSCSVCLSLCLSICTASPIMFKPSLNQPLDLTASFFNTEHREQVPMSFGGNRQIQFRVLAVL